MYKFSNKLIVVSLVCALAFVAPAPSSALVTSQRVAAVSAVTMSWSGSSLVINWKSPVAGSNALKSTGYRVQIKSGKLTQTKTLGATTRRATFVNLKKTLTFAVQIWSVTSKYQSLPYKSAFLGAQNKQSNALTYQPLTDMFIDASPQPIVVSARSANAVAQSMTPAKCVIENKTLKPLAVGECVVEFRAAATKYFVAAQTVEQRFTIAPRSSGPQKVLLWEDTFDSAAGTAPQSSNWTADISDGCQAPYNNCGWGNTERQWYLESQNRHDGNGKLTITANRLDNSSNLSCYYGKCEWRSGKITTFNKVSFTYGYIEASIKAPKGGGTWPAFWMLGTNIQTVPWPRCGELDIWEYKGSFPKLTYGTVHFANNGGGHTYLGGTKDALVDLSDDYHRYGMLWQEDQITFYLDDVLVYAVTKAQTGLAYWPFGKNAQGQDPKFYAIFNLAMGGHFGGPIDSQVSNAEIKVDWVKYYSVDGVGKVTLN